MPILDGGTVSDPGGEDAGGIPIPDAYGVTVQAVRELATHVGPDPTATDPDFGAETHTITDAKITGWVLAVADGVRAYVSVLARHRTNTTRWVAIEGAARTAILNGAAAYLVSAAHPMKAGTNRSESYSAELWERHNAMVGLLTDLPGTYADEDAAGVVDEVTGTVGVDPIVYGGQSSIPSSLFHHQPALGYPYRAPGAEHPYPDQQRWPGR